jgi:hypothetical protein
MLPQPVPNFELQDVKMSSYSQLTTRLRISNTPGL